MNPDSSPGHRMRPHPGLTTIAVGIAGIPSLVTGTLLILAALISPRSDRSCAGPAGDSVLTAASGSRVPTLTVAQRRNASAIITAGRQRHLPDQAVVIALATASQESGFRNYPNDGRGGDLIWSQAGIERSLRLPHE